MPTPKTIAIIGAGGRGKVFADLAADHPHLARIAAVAEPRDSYRKRIVDEHGLAPGMVFRTWQDFVAQPRLCDAAVIATMDREHVGPAVACLEKGYDLLLEKPMAVTLADCKAIEAAQRRSGRIVGVCHSMRYHKVFRKVKELVDAGSIGRIVSLDQLEQVAYWHQAHSFVRGNWANQGRSTFMLMAKSCHDIDYIAYLVGRPCLRVCSFGALTHFTAANAPPGSTARCTDGCPAEPSCPYSAIRQYTAQRLDAWPADVVSFEHTVAAHMEAIRTGPYGRCVYRCDNDVVDHQVVALEFEDDVTATFTMTGMTQGHGRRLRIHGDRGDLFMDETDTITVRTYLDNNVATIRIAPETGAHGGGDQRVFQAWLNALHTRDTSALVADAQESLRTHTIVFAAEQARLEKRVVSLSELAAV